MSLVGLFVAQCHVQLAEQCCHTIGGEFDDVGSSNKMVGPMLKCEKERGWAPNDKDTIVLEEQEVITFKGMFVRWFFLDI